MNPEPLTIEQALCADDYKIPLYQRNYDWGERETLQLISDIADYARRHAGDTTPYYLGSLVVLKRQDDGREYYETVDGQQRLTTLNLIAMVLRRLCPEEMEWYHGPRLGYMQRAGANEALARLNRGEMSRHPIAGSLNNAYRIIERHFDTEEARKWRRQFARYLSGRVILMRIPLPADTELNHYFEIMNSRGEQLEKHEVLKARLMDKLDHDCPRQRQLFNEIWEACSDMTVYVQMKFAPERRKSLFSPSHDAAPPDSFDGLMAGFTDKRECSQTLAELIGLAQSGAPNPYLPAGDSGADDGRPDRFTSVINFPNFLLHVLKVMRPADDIALDDKRLIEIFDSVLRRMDDEGEFVRSFIVTLLRLRYLFDRYIIKRSADKWRVQRIKSDYLVNTFGDGDDDTEEAGKEIRMLQGMFHFSDTRHTYKHWLYMALRHLHGQAGAADPGAFRDCLWHLAQDYMRERYLSASPRNLDDIASPGFVATAPFALDLSKLKQGCGIDNFVFNFYDFCLWRSDPGANRNFEFTYRTSVEHFYPQKPDSGNHLLTREEGLDHFGNLCLISSGMNSKFSNNMPKAKVENFGSDETKRRLSLKLNATLDYARDHQWESEDILRYHDECVALLLQALNCPI